MTETTIPTQLVQSPTVASARLRDPLPTLLHPYILPFCFIYPAFFYVYTSKYDEYIGGQEWTFVFLGSIICVEILLWLMTSWSINIKALFTSVSASYPTSAKLIHVVPAPNCGAAELCPIIHKGSDDIYFFFQRRKFIYSHQSKSFSPPTFPIDHEPNLSELQHAQGIPSSQVDHLLTLYGKNIFDIPVPTFLDLFKEHAVAPFFVFQVFCVALWFLDEKWYYSLFTLVMLLVFESVVVFQRKSTMTEFQGMNIKPFDLYVLRDKKWQELQSSDLLPGDVISLLRTKDESAVPCDLILLSGTAIVNEAMLSGESTPLLKDSILLRPGNEKVDLDGLDKNAVVHGGTKVLQVTNNDGATASSSRVLPPDGGAIAYVVKTGFETSQGQLVRTMIFSTERVGAANKEALLFILFLLVFAIAASWYVWTEGVKIDRVRSKLLLDCVLIITSVVPPELPMELSVAVNTSLAALSKHAIFCTEPFRIPYAGRVDVCCFDKTGTLTGEDLLVEGVAGIHTGELGFKSLVSLDRVPKQTTALLAAAHALVLLDDGDVVGDPMEKNTINSLGWNLEKGNKIVNKNNSKQQVRIVRRFQFSSALKRSSSVATFESKSFIAVKGAPETLKHMIKDIPADYESTYKEFTRNGSRVLALAYRTYDRELSIGEINNLKRENVESLLTFGGFLVLSCPLKEDAISAVAQLNSSSHRVVMITGDNPLTAVHVAKTVEIVERDVLILDLAEGGSTSEDLVWKSVDETIEIKVDPTKPVPQEIFDKYDLCVTGHGLAAFADEPHVVDLIRHTWVYARVSPIQKEFIIITLKNAGYTTLMCGDGTNDVGALKQAQVGVALLNGTEEGLKKIAENQRIRAIQDMYNKQLSLMQRWGSSKVLPVPPIIAHLYPPGPNNPSYRKAIEARGGKLSDADIKKIEEAEKQQQQQQPQGTQQANVAAAGFADKMMAALQENGGDDTEPPKLKLGDASVAAPFTSKLAAVSSVIHIIRQGRCALVTTIQMYKILALNCLISAYSLSVLFFAGIKFGDTQATISGVLLSVCFLSVSRAKSIEKLSKERPQPGIFNIYIMGSILGQFAFHVISLIYITGLVYRLEPKMQDIDLDAEFSPSLLNTAIYLLQLAQQVSTFAVNYQGLPFRERITDNKGMYYGLLGVSALTIAGSTEFIPEINEKLMLVPMTSYFKIALTLTILLDFGLCFLVELVLKHFFMDSKPKDIAIHVKYDNEKKVN